MNERDVIQKQSHELFQLKEKLARAEAEAKLQRDINAQLQANLGDMTRQFHNANAVANMATAFDFQDIEIIYHKGLKKWLIADPIEFTVLYPEGWGPTDGEHYGLGFDTTAHLFNYAGEAMQFYVDFISNQGGASEATDQEAEGSGLDPDGRGDMDAPES